MPRKTSLKRDHIATYRLSEAEEKLVDSLVALRQLPNVAELLRVLIFNDALMLLPESAELRATSKAFPPPLFTAPIRSWDALTQSIIRHGRASRRAGFEPPEWVVALLESNNVLLDVESVFPEQPPSICCASPKVGFVGARIFCEACSIDLAPIAAAQICLWRGRMARGKGNILLAAEYDDQARRFTETSAIRPMFSNERIVEQGLSLARQATRTLDEAREPVEIAMDDVERNYSAMIALGALMRIILTECSVDGKTVRNSTVLKLGRGLMQQWLNITVLLDKHRADGYPFFREVTDDWFPNFVSIAFKELEKKGWLTWQKGGYWKIGTPEAETKKRVSGQKKSTTQTHCFNGQCDITKPNTATLPVVGSLAPFCSCECSRCVSRRNTEQKRNVA